MSTPSPEHNVDPRAERKVDHEQFPVDASIWKVSFDASGTVGDFLRIVVMSGQSTTQNQAYTEYHHNNASVCVDDVGGFVLRCATLTSSQTAIDGFVGTMPQRIAIPQAASWCRGVYTPTAPYARLYKAPDPDDTTKLIGVLIEQDTQSRLVQITWYKTRDATALFRSTPSTLEFELVRSATGAPSTDPNDMGGWTWYYTTSLLTC